MKNTDVIDLIYRALQEVKGKRGFKNVKAITIDGDGIDSSLCLTVNNRSKKQDWFIESRNLTEFQTSFRSSGPKHPITAEKIKRLPKHTIPGTSAGFDAQGNIAFFKDPGFPIGGLKSQKRKPFSREFLIRWSVPKSVAATQ